MVLLLPLQVIDPAADCKRRITEGWKKRFIHHSTSIILIAQVAAPL